MSSLRRLPPAARSLLFGAAYALGPWTTALGAQRVDSLPAGARVRVVLEPRGRTVEATYLGADSTGLRVATSAPGAYPWRDVRRVERSAGMARASDAFHAGMQRGALVGAGVGALVLTGFGVAHLLRAPVDAHDRFELAMVGAAGVLYTGLFAVAGGVLGLGHPHREQWVPVQLRP